MRYKEGRDTLFRGPCEDNELVAGVCPRDEVFASINYEAVSLPSGRGSHRLRVRPTFRLSEAIAHQLAHFDQLDHILVLLFLGAKLVYYPAAHVIYGKRSGSGRTACRQSLNNNRCL